MCKVSPSKYILVLVRGVHVHFFHDMVNVTYRGEEVGTSS